MGLTLRLNFSAEKLCCEDCLFPVSFLSYFLSIGVFLHSRCSCVKVHKSEGENGETRIEKRERVVRQDRERVAQRKEMRGRKE